MTSEKETSRRLLDQSRGVSDIDRKRRSLTKVGLSTPVLMTLASRPALAKRCSPSVLASGNLSDPVDTSTCGACTTQQWLNATPQDFQACGIPDPTVFGLSQVFNVPDVRTSFGSVPIVSGSCLDALQGTCVMPTELRFVDSLHRIFFPQSAGRQTLGNLMCYALTLVLNGLHPTTSMNINNYSVGSVISDVNNVLVVGHRNTINVEQLAFLEQACAFLMSDGSSCALI